MARSSTAAAATRAPAIAWVRAHAHGLALFAVVAGGLWLRFYQIGTESYWFDEICTLYLAGARADTGFINTVIPITGTEYIALAAVWIRAFGTSEAATRALSALCGSACIVLMYKVGRDWLDRRTGLIAATLLAVSAFQIHYAQDFRFYTPFLLLTLLSLLYFMRAIEGGGPWSHVLLALFTILSLYIHAHALFTVLAQGAYLVVRWRSLGRAVRTRLALTFAAVALAALPMLASAARAAVVAGSAGALGWVEPPTVSLVGRTVYWFLFPLRHERSWASMALGAAGAGLLLVVGTVAHGRRVGVRAWLGHLAALRDAPARLGRHWNVASLLVLWALIPIVAPFVLSWVVGPMYVERYTIAASPAWYLLLGLALDRVRRVVPLAVTLTALAVLIVPGLGHYYAVDVKEQWDEVAGYIEAHGRPGDVIIVAPEDHGWNLRALEWYYQGALPRCGVDADLEGAELATAFRACSAGHERGWVVMRGPTALLRRFEDVLLDEEQAGVQLVPQRAFVRVALYLSEASPR